MKLFRVVCRGTMGTHGVAYVIAEDSNRAYTIMHDDLTRRSIGCANERELGMIELVAEDAEYPTCDRRLYRQPND